MLKTKFSALLIVAVGAISVSAQATAMGDMLQVAVGPAPSLPGPQVY
jgi:hypothetical protein